MSTYTLPKLSSSFSSFTTKSTFPLAIEEELELEDEAVLNPPKNRKDKRRSWIHKGIVNVRRSLNLGANPLQFPPEQSEPCLQNSHLLQPQIIEGVQFGRPLASSRMRWFSVLKRRSSSSSNIHNLHNHTNHQNQNVPIRSHTSNSHQVPILVVACVQRLHLDITTEGLFRVSGEGSRVSRLREAWEMGGNLSDLSALLLHDSPHNVAALLVQYLIFLPEPLIPTKYYWEFLRLGRKTASGTYTQADQVQRGQRLIRKIPTEHRILLRYLLGFLVAISGQEASNRMSARNLSLVFGPVIMRWPKNVKDITLLKIQANVIEVLIVRFEQMFHLSEAEIAQLNEQEQEMQTLLQEQNSELGLGFGASQFMSGFYADTQTV
eukprot:TRINITY_DN3139_c0_g1_i1.p1 TRINITY_DN3139_c0_g1~~TRINITY_DN3139_c0_g1_i1.p1  ORF type:complete len:378 (+),score=62.45 TRINITY_DN3139_c0_g1_i1:46-1179(+)